MVRVRIYQNDMIQHRALREMWSDIKKFEKNSYTIDPLNPDHRIIIDLAAVAIRGLNLVIHKGKLSR